MPRSRPDLGSRTEIVLGWIPPEIGGTTLQQSAPTLLPAVLYADRVTIMCPEADDAFELSDFSEIRSQFGDDVDYDPVESHDDIRAEVREDALERARQAISSGDDAGSRAALAMINARGYVEIRNPRHLEREGLLGISRDLARQIVAEQEDTWQASERGSGGLDSVARQEDIEVLMRAFCTAAQTPGRYAILDDATNALRRYPQLAPAPQVSGFAEARASEAGLAANVLARLPSPDSRQPWDVAADIRKELQVPLVRFRSAMARLSDAIDAHPMGESFPEAAEVIWRIEIQPAMDELEQLVRGATLREVFFSDVTGDLSTYAGPSLALVSAVSADLPALLTAALAAGTPFVQTVSHMRERQRSRDSHELLFVREVVTRFSS